MAIMKQYKQGELPENMYGNEASKQGDSKTNVVKGATALPCLLYTSPSPRDGLLSRMPSSA